MLNYILYSIFYILFIYLSAKNIKWGIFLIVTLLPTYLIRFTILGIPATLLEGMIWLLFIVWLIKLKKEKGLTFNPVIWFKNIIGHRSLIIDHQNPIPKALRLPLILFLIASTISVFVSPDLRSAAGLWKAYFIEPMLLFIIFIYTIKTTDDLKKVIRCLGLTAIVIGIFAVIQKFTGLLIPNPFWADEATRRVTTFFGYPNANALFLAPIVILTLGNLIDDFRAKVFSFKFFSNNPWSSNNNLHSVNRRHHRPNHRPHLPSHLLQKNAAHYFTDYFDIQHWLNFFSSSQSAIAKNLYFSQ